MRFRTMNPVFRRVSHESAFATEDAASYSGVISKSALLLAIMFFFGALSMNRLIGQAELPPGGIAMLIAAPIIGLICVIVAMTKPQAARIASIIYAVAQGTFLGVISGMYEIIYQNHIVATALVATGGVFAAMLFLYASGLVRVSNMMRKILFTALLGLVITSFVLMLLFAFGGFSYEQNIGLIFAIVVISVIVASLYLLVDFDNIERMVKAGAPKHYEWVLSLGLLVTLVWLYVELLRLIAILQRRR